MSIGPEQWVELKKAVHECFRHDVAGVVITHGSATLEETAYFLDLVIDDERPIVFTGAIRPISAVSTDALLNVIGAASIAADPASSQLGCLVTLGGEIHAARYATKLGTYSVNSFSSSNGGPIGEVIGSRVHYFVKPFKKFKLAPKVLPLPRVDIVISYAGSDGYAIDAAIVKGAKGIVVAGFGPGDVTKSELESMRRARAKGVEVVQSSRTIRGQVLTRTDLRHEGFVAAGRLTPQKARVLTMVALSAGLTGNSLQDAFEGAA
jgi:L-asparaginase